MGDSAAKWAISLWSLLLVIIIFNPFTFMLTDLLGKLNPNLKTLGEGGKITYFGWILHWVVFFLLVRLIMEIKLPGSQIK